MTTDSELENQAEVWFINSKLKYADIESFKAGARYASEKSAKEIASLKETLAELKFRHLDVVKERDKLRAENEKQAARISELEAGVREINCRLNEDRFCTDELFELMAALLSPKDTQEEVISK